MLPCAHQHLTDDLAVEIHWARMGHDGFDGDSKMHGDLRKYAVDNLTRNEKVRGSIPRGGSAATRPLTCTDSQVRGLFHDHEQGTE